MTTTLPGARRGNRSGLPSGLSLFATAYDPLDLASGSVDPLGFTKGYLALADRLLPGFTTVTGVPRYLPMLCAGLQVAEHLHPRIPDQAPAQSRKKRMAVLAQYEKLWALACGLAAQAQDESAIAGLRGVRYVRRFLDSNAARSDLCTGEFELLKNQVRYGGIGTYGQMLEACHFVDWASLTLRPLGEQLAKEFPAHPTWSAERGNGRVNKDALRAWGAKVSVTGVPAGEAMVLRRGLAGDIEAERDDDVRWHCLRLLKAAGAGDGIAEHDCLAQLCRLIEPQPAGPPRKLAALGQLRAVAPLIRPFEQLYQALTYLFDEVRAMATEAPGGCLLANLDRSRGAADALTAAQQGKRELEQQLVASEQLDAPVTLAIKNALHSSGITILSQQVSAATSPAQAAEVLLQRHLAVQAGKFDQGQRKAPWLRLDRGIARLTAQRNELPRTQHVVSWRETLRHPYRTGAAGRFIAQCRIP